MTGAEEEALTAVVSGGVGENDSTSVATVVGARTLIRLRQRRTSGQKLQLRLSRTGRSHSRKGKRRLQRSPELRARGKERP